MPIFLDGQQNLSALQEPGVYVDIVTPKPILAGQPTNNVGLVGVASWGPVGGVTLVTSPTDAAVKIGTPIIRTYDMSTYIEAASNVGGAAVYNCVRVSDGNDVAATATIQTNCLTLTGLYTGSLGNSIRFSMAQGTATGSFMASVAFPGAAPEIFNNIGQGISNPVTTPGTGYTAVPSVALSYSFASSTNPNNVIPAVHATLTVVSATVGSTSGCSGFAIGDTMTLVGGYVLTIATLSGGAPATVTITNGGSLTAGSIPTNPIAMTSTNGSGIGTPTFNLVWGLGAPVIVRPGSGLAGAPTATLSGGGSGSGSYVFSLSPWLNLANAINLGNPSHGPSKYIIATAGVGTSAPTLGVTATLSGGTDGAALVTDTTLVGTDTFPRKGMYALRSSGVAAFTLCDLSTSSLWPTADVFALSEGSLFCVSTVSGDSIANAVATRVSVGLDDEWTWITVGDYPTFYDAQNQVSRLVSPSAFQIGFVGNYSPELSPLNKPLRGISATQRTQTLQAYADADLQFLNQNGVDIIIGPPTTLGGDYFTFASGRNASSNTAANGVEYTTLTNYLAKTAQSKAAGSIVGQLQSIQPNDQTRANAKALFDGFSAQLSLPQSGSNGYGLIDEWSTVCDLTNNPPSTQALGYLFLYWNVRYLNTIRYFVIKLMGGGNVTITSQATAPTVTQILAS